MHGVDHVGEWDGGDRASLPEGICIGGQLGVAGGDRCLHGIEVGSVHIRDHGSGHVVSVRFDSSSSWFGCGLTD
jgi:hypothetical protein